MARPGSEKRKKVSPVVAFDRSRRLFETACNEIAGGVNSNVRLGNNPVPLFFARAHGSHLTDVDGNDYVDYALGMGPVILGHAAEAVTGAVQASLSDGQLYAGQHLGEIELARAVKQAYPSADLVRFGMTGSEVVQAAFRVARAYTGRRKIVKFVGHYHGWFDNVLLSVAPGLGRDLDVAEKGEPQLQSNGQVPTAAAEVITMPWNDIKAIRTLFQARGDEIAAVITEPIMCNTGVISPHDGYLAELRKLCTDCGILLVFDEVITGLRIGLGGAQEKFGIVPDLTVLAKAVGNGFPIAVLGGKREILAAAGTGAVNHSGTYNSNVVSIAAGIATLRELSKDGGALYGSMHEVGTALFEGLRDAARRAKSDLQVQGYPTVFNTYFGSAKQATDYRSYQANDSAKQKRFVALLLEEGIRPTSRATWFLSAAHDAKDVERTVDGVENALRRLEAGNN
jgi:glutamate-1-semialdehyde 2,1-aminomutase